MLSSTHPCTSCVHTWGYGRYAKKAYPLYPHRVLHVCFTYEIWRAGALPLRGQQEVLVKEVSRKLFSSEQASDGREAHRGSVSGSEHSWAVQAPPAAPAAVGDVWFGISVSHTKCLHV